MLHQGKLKGWDSGKGTGFIQQDKAGSDIRINSAGFRKKPVQLQNGDGIFFQIEVDPQGKPKAVYAYKAGQHLGPAPTFKKPVTSSLPFQKLISALVVLSILGLLGYQFAYLLSSETTFSAENAADTGEFGTAATVLDSPVWPPIQARQEEQFQCEGKQHCSEMKSCEEAEFYLEQCPNVLIDGDNDGIPCERQVCSHRWF